MRRKQENPTIRILLLGAAGVGKDCLESRFTTSTYPPLYDTSLTLNSRRYFTLSPHAPTSPTETRPLNTSHGLEPLRQSQDLEPGDVRSPRSASSTFSNPASELRRQEEAKEMPASNSSDASDKAAEMCEDCRRSAQQDATYLVELTNYPDLQHPRVRAQVYARGEFDAVLLVYDVGNRASFEAVHDLHGEIPLRQKRRGRKPSSVGHNGTVRKSRSSIFVRGGHRAAGFTEGRETVVALVGNKSDFDEEYDSRERLLSEKEAVLQEADVEERSLVHPLYRESRVYDDMPLSPAKSTRSTPNVFYERAARDIAADARRSVLSADHALLGTRGEFRSQSALGHSRSVRTMPLPGHKRGSSLLQMSPQVPLARSIERWIETGNPSVLDSAEVEMEDITRVESQASDEEQTAAARRQVSRLEGEYMARSLLLNVPFFETSAKSGENVEEVFDGIVREVLREMGHSVGDEYTAVECKQRHGARSTARRERKGEVMKKAAVVDIQAAAESRPGTESREGSERRAETESRASKSPIDPVLEDAIAEDEADPPLLPPIVPKRSGGSVLGRFKRVFTKKTPAMVANVA